MNRFTLIWFILLVGIVSCDFANEDYGYNEGDAEFCRDIVPILESKCIICHNERGAAPFSLENYKQVKYHSETIIEVLQSGYMPPWYVDSHNSIPFSNDRSIDSLSKEILVEWIEKGLYVDDKNCGTNNQIKEKGSDISIRNPNSVIEVKGNSQETFYDITIPFNFDTDIDVSALKVYSKNNEIAHHAIYSVVNQMNQSYDRLDSVFIFNVFNMPNIVMTGGWVPGYEVMKLNDNYGFTLPSNGSININMHYSPSSKTLFDTIYIEIDTMSSEIKNRIYFIGVNAADTSTVSLNKPFLLKANTIDTFKMEKKFESCIEILSITPHMHYLGKSFKAYIVSSSNDTTKLLNLPRWNFYWQENYQLLQPLQVSPNATLYIESVFDNTSSNPLNPFSPPQNITEGWRSVDEMMMLIMTVAHLE